MSLPLDTNHDDEELERYVLGLLPAKATERLDEASIADDEVAARLRMVETDLVDSYVRGKLAGETLERFESHYLSSPRRRESVRVAASFVRAVDRSVTRADGVTWKERIARPARLTWIMAAAALVMVVGGVLLFEAVQPRNESTIATSGSGTIERPTPEVAQQLAGDRSGAAPVERREPDRSSAAGSAPAVAPGSPDGRRAVRQGIIVAVVLLPPTRAVAPIPTLAVPAAADRVRFELRLESNDFPRYQVELKDPATNNVLWRSGWIPPTASADLASVSVVVPAKLLGPQHYSLDLAGRADGGGAEVIGSYTVRVERP
jgi:hypothetical protein